jgi:uncharacterized protein YjiS (DUF1127 family)
MTAEQLNATRSKHAGTLHVLDLWSVLSRLVDLVGSWRDNARSRHALRGLSDHTLKDIGITRSDAYREWAKPFWRD